MKKIFTLNFNWFLGFIAVIFSVLLLDLISYYFLNNEILIHFFRLKLEKNLPSILSTLQLMVGGSILFKIYKLESNLDQKKSNYRYWKYLSFTFFFLAADEWFSIHDQASFFARFFGNVGDFFEWTLAYFVIIPIFFFVFLKFIRELPKKTVFMFLFSGCIFLIGSIGFEILGFFQDHHFSQKVEDFLPYYYISYLEEFLEIIAIFIFNYSAFIYLKKHLNQNKLLLPKKLYIISLVFFLLDILGTYLHWYF